MKATRQGCFHFSRFVPSVVSRYSVPNPDKLYSRQTARGGTGAERVAEPPKGRGRNAGELHWAGVAPVYVSCKVNAGERCMLGWVGGIQYRMRDRCVRGAVRDGTRCVRDAHAMLRDVLIVLIHCVLRKCFFGVFIGDFPGTSPG